METIDLEQVKIKLRQIIVNDLECNIRLDEISDDVSLYEDGIGLDSIAIVNFVVIIENRFGITFEEGEINAGLFSNINNLSVLVSSKLNR
jgi:acyl carrier protein